MINKEKNSVLAAEESAGEPQDVYLVQMCLELVNIRFEQPQLPPAEK